MTTAAVALSLFGPRTTECLASFTVVYLLQAIRGGRLLVLSGRN